MRISFRFQIKPPFEGFLGKYTSPTIFFYYDNDDNDNDDDDDYDDVDDDDDDEANDDKGKRLYCKEVAARPAAKL